MKTTLKLSTLIVAIASVFTFSSCLEDSDSTTYPNYSSYVTINGDAIMGYTFHSDFGCTLIPTSASVQEVLPGLSSSDVKRAYVAFDLASEDENGQTLEKDRIYDIILRSSYYANYAIPTYQTINISDNTMAADSLTTKNQLINHVDNNIWAINGYINAALTINYDQNKTFSVCTFYSEEDVDVTNNTLNLNIYYNSNSLNTSAQGQSVFSFRLPEDAVDSHQFTADSITVVLNAITDYNENSLTKVGECMVALEDFREPRY